MKIMLMIFTFVGCIFLISLFFGFPLINFTKNPKIKSFYGISLGFLFFFYILFSLILGFFSIIKKDIYLLSFFVFAILPFLIGNISTYKNLRFYLSLQIFTVLASLDISFIYLLNY